MVPVLQLLALLGIHWIADFVLQTHWQASNKSKDLIALGRHVGTYTVALCLGSLVLFGPLGIGFALVNGALHFATDYFTSRWTSKHVVPALADTHKAMTYTDSYNEPPNDVQCRLLNIEPGRHWHNFFVVIGLDQFIHQATLTITMLLFLQWGTE